MRNPLSIIFILLVLFAHAQKNPNINDLRDDSVKCRTLDEMIEKEDDPKVWLKYNQQMMDIANSNLAHLEGTARIVYLKYLANGLNNLAFYLQETGNVDSTLKLYHKSLEMRYDIKDRVGIANSLNNIGHIYFKLSDFNKASNYYNKAIKVQQDLKDSAGLSTTYNNLGSLYDLFNKKDEAAALFNKSLQIRKSLQDSLGMAFCYNNLAKIWTDKGDYQKGLNLQLKALGIREALHSPELGTSYNNIGMIYLRLNDPKKAQHYLEEALSLHKQLKDRQSEAVSYKNLGLLYQTEKQVDKAIGCFENALAISRSLNYPEDMFRPARGLYELYRAKGNYKKSLEMFELYQQLKDSLGRRKDAALMYVKDTVQKDTVVKKAAQSPMPPVPCEKDNSLYLILISTLGFATVGLGLWVVKLKR